MDNTLNIHNEIDSNVFNNVGIITLFFLNE